MKKISNIMKVSFITNFCLSIVKVVVGFIGHSNALISDGIHSFSDLITDIVAIFGSDMSLKKADDKHPYGHGKSEYITSFIIGLVVLFLGLGLISNVFNKTIIIPSILVILVSIFTIISKYLLSNYLINKGNNLKNEILIASGKESKADVLSSIVVLISSILMQCSNKIEIFKYSDLIASIIVGIMIVKTGFNILKDSISMILGEQETDEETLNSFKSIILKNKEIKTIDSFLCIKYGPYYKIDTEVSMDPNLTLLKAHTIIDNIEKNLKQKNQKAKYITIHINPSIE